MRCYQSPIKLKLTLASLALAALATPLSASGLAQIETPDPEVPKTAPGFPKCEVPLHPSSDLPRGEGERFVYEIKMMGLPLGTVQVEAARRGSYRGRSVTEYRGWVEPVSVVNALFSVEASISNFIPEDAFTPVDSMLQYSFRGDRFKERQLRSDDGKKLLNQHAKNGRMEAVARAFPEPVHDFLSGFFFLRRLPENAHGCMIVYGQKRAYTVWIQPEGEEKLDTGAGRHTFERYLLRYNSEKSKKVKRAHLWVSSGPERIPFKIKTDARLSPVVQLKGYRLAGK